MLLRATPACGAARLGAPRVRARRAAGCAVRASSKHEPTELTPACDLFSDNAKAAECWAGAAELTVPGSPAHGRCAPPPRAPPGARRGFGR